MKNCLHTSRKIKNENILIITAKESIFVKLSVRDHKLLTPASQYHFDYQKIYRKGLSKI